VGCECLSVGILVADHLSPPIARVPRAGELILVDDLPLAIGGCASNTAMDLARVGVDVAVVGCVGHDPFGRFIIETLAAQKIDTTGIRQLEGTPTSGTLIINVTGEDRRFIHCAGANARLQVEHLDFEQIKAAKVFYVGGYLLMPGLVPERLADLFRRARAAGVTTVLDVVVPGPGNHFETLAPVLRETDVFLPNSDEAHLITGLADPVAQAERFLQAGARTAVITCGNEGTILLSEQLRLRAGIYPVNFVGGTGAGDAFDAGYIAGLLAGADARRCLQWGSALGASCVRAIGATESVFNRPEAEAFMRDQPLAIETF
jgi:sugar/nucleoside kinase (ribokinase family)